MSILVRVAEPRSQRRPSIGKVLLAGGLGGSGGLATAELYDPATGTWSATGSLGQPRFYVAS